MNKKTNKIIKKIIKIVAIVFICLFLFSLSNIYAQGGINPSDYEPSNLVITPSAANKISPIVGTITMIGIITSILVIIILGIKYMIGSVEERAEYKKTMIPYLIGAVMLFSITTVVQVIINITGSVFK